MRGTHHKIRIVLVLAVAIAALGLVSSASARFMPEDDSANPVLSTPAPVEVTTNDGFNWGSALTGAGVAIGAALSIGATGYLVRHRSRLAT